MRLFAKLFEFPCLLDPRFPHERDGVVVHLFEIFEEHTMVDWLVAGAWRCWATKFWSSGALSIGTSALIIETH